jgi:hypothetical protein
MKRAQLMADAVAVVCPHCGEPQPNPSDGSEQWTLDDFVKAPPTKACVACDKVMLVGCDRKVQFCERVVVLS